MMRIGIVVTLINAEFVLETFISYHLSIGFDHIFLFFDNPIDPGFDSFKDNPKVTAIKNDKDLHLKWEETESFLYQHQYINKEVMARQILNANVALKLCMEKGITWLLHIDIDELFYSPNGSVKEHFRQMESSNKNYLLYLNHEALPEKMNIKDYFQEVNLFKANIRTLSEGQIKKLEQSMTEEKSYFLFYANGKAAIKVSNDVVATGVRDFECDSRKFTVQNPAILHFPCCGFSHFWIKYQTLGFFSDNWWGLTDITKYMPVHSNSRDIVLKQSDLLAKAFYQDCFLNQHLGKRDEFLTNGIFFRSSIVQTVLKK